jgi:hypothetical protein
MSQEQKLVDLKEMISSMERTLFAARSIISELSGETPILSSKAFFQNQTTPIGAERGDEEGKVIEGAFDGQGMIDEAGKTYPVPVNYASKSKIVVGDRMKLTITSSGKFVYKQIGPVNRVNILGPLTCEDGQYKVLSAGKEYLILTASITFHKAMVGDEISILLPEGADAKWGALDAIVPKGKNLNNENIYEF